MRSNIILLTLAAVLTGTLHPEIKPNPLFSRVHNAVEEAPKANYPEIRSFKVPVTVSVTSVAEAKGSWIACSPSPWTAGVWR